MKLGRLFTVISVFLFISGIGIAQNYVGSTVCQGCHNVVNPNTGYNIWEEYMTSGHPYKLNEVNNAPPTYPPNTSSGVPNPPPGHNWSEFVYVIGGYGWKGRFVKLDGKIFTEDSSAQWNLETQAWVPYEYGLTKKYNYACFKCHTTGASTDGSWNGVPADSLGTFSEPGIRCEGCHGPGSDHIADPTNVTPPITGTNLQITRCGDCHQRGGTTNNIPAGGGYIQHHEQINEMRASKHGDGIGAELTCASCHEVHVPLRYPDATPEEGIHTNCEDCHAGMEILLNGQPKNIECVDCHMPDAGKSAVGHVVGNGRWGDVATHIWGINTDAVDYTGMFNTGLTAVLLDGDGLAHVTLDFVCLRCHTDKDVNWASEYADSIHIKGISDVEGEEVIPSHFKLNQNYPNPFNPSTTISFSVPEASVVNISVYSLTGEMVMELVNRYMPAGNHQFTFVADELPSGIYIYKMTATPIGGQAGEFSDARKMTLLR